MSHISEDKTHVITIQNKDTTYSATWYHTDDSSLSSDGKYDTFLATLSVTSSSQGSYTLTIDVTCGKWDFDYPVQFRVGSTSGSVIWSCSAGDFPSPGGNSNNTITIDDYDAPFYIYALCGAPQKSSCGMEINEGTVTVDSWKYAYGKAFQIVDSISWYTAPSNVGTYQITGISGTTIIINTPTWTNGSNNGSVTTATCRIWATNSSGTEVGNAISTTNSGATTDRITGLTTGTTYYINAQVSDGTGNTGSTVTVSSSDGNTSATTYKCQVTISAVSTCRIKYTAEITHGSIGSGTTNQLSRSNLAYYVKQGSTTKLSTVIDSDYICSNTVTGGLTHGTLTTVYCYVNGVTNASGNIDTEVSASDTTYTLSLSGTGSTSHQHSIVTTWQAYANSSAQNADNISGTAYYFNNATLSSKNTSGYISQGSDGNTSYSVIYNTSGSYSYSYNKSIYYYNLTYYCQYTATAYLTDGTNTVSATMTVATTYPYARIYYNGAWRKAFVYIYSGGWKLAVGHVYSSGWKEFNGE